MPAKKHKKPTKTVQKLPPESPAARDEGPRLIPLPPIKAEHPRLARLIELADKALTEPISKKKSGTEPKS